MKNLIHNIFGKPAIVKLFERLSGALVLKKIPVGIEPALDIKFRFGENCVNTIIDVGANVGQSALYFRNWFPKAQIHCIEPIDASFLELKSKIKELKISCYNVGLGSEEKKVLFKVLKKEPNSVQNSIQEPGIDNIKNDNFYLEEKVLLPLDTFLEVNEISQIDYLKIDTEGYDLEVLKGASATLKNQRVKFIQVEASMNPYNKDHVSFFEMIDYLKNYNYHLFGLYEQIHDFKIKRYILRRVNALFIRFDEADYSKNISKEA